MTSLRPFQLDVPQAQLDRIMRRVADANISYAPSDDENWKYGIDRQYLSDFRDYWRDAYDWRAQEAWFNRFPQFRATIEGVDIHFYHVRASGGGYPLILSHGWPGSIVEFMDVIPLLVAQGYDVVVPSLPGYGFSGRPAAPIGRDEVARMWRTLMVDVLGYKYFSAQGGDWGSPITQCLGRNYPEIVRSIHVNLLFARHVPGAPISPELEAWLKAGRASKEGSYAELQRTKPQTIGLALADTPIGWAAWVLEKCRTWADNDGDIEKRFSKDALLNNIMTYLIGETIQSSFWLYYSLNFVPPEQARVTVPVGFAEFKESRPPPPRSALDPDFNIVRWTKMPRGGHFAAWEQPELFAEEVGDFFREWR